MFTEFFIRRPILSAVLSIVIVIAGIASMLNLPVSQYPEILPPEISISATYPGASAEVVAETVAAPLEQQLNGVDNMLYLRSSSSSNGRLTINVSFAVGTDPDQALIDVNNRVQAALPSLPEETRRLGVNARKATSSILGVVMLSAPDGRYDELFVSNYGLINVVDELLRVPGVGDARLFGLMNYSMRIWLDPERMAATGLTPSDVAAALRDQNAQLPAGRVGAEPQAEEVDFTFTLVTRGRLTSVEEFGAVIVRSTEDGSVVRLRDIARVELGARDYDFKATLNGKPAVPIGIFLQPGANALATMDGVRERLAELQGSFPEGLVGQVPYDTTKFVRISIQEVAWTLLEAFVLVFGVVFLFLQNWRATVIPSLAVPVSLIGTFAAMYMLGFTINTLTLFGMVLAIGIVVDDAIIVIENVERIMAEEGLEALPATIKAMEQVAGPVIAIVLVLAAVFVPVAFLGGLSGEMYKQFAITIAVSVAISGLVALTLTPALCAAFLRHEHRTVIGPLQRFNNGFARLTSGYTAGVRWLLRHTAVTVLLFAAVGGAALLLFRLVPSALLPNEDQGTVIAAALLPDAASLSRTEKVITQMSEFAAGHPQVENFVSLIGFDILSGSLKTSSGIQFLSLKDWSERTGPGQSSFDLAGQVMGNGAENIRDAFVLGINPPPIQGLSTTGGFELYIESRAEPDYGAIAAVVGRFIEAADTDPALSGVRTTFSAKVPQLRLDIDRDKALSMGVSLTALAESLQSTFGALYVNDFNLQGRTFQVVMQAESGSRAAIEDLRRVFVRNREGALIPLNALVREVQDTGPELVERFNNFPAIKVIGEPRPGVSSGAAIAAVERIAAEQLPQGYTLAWTGSAYQEKQIGSTSALAFLAGLLMVFLILAAQYERWSLPLAVVLSVPFALLGALLAVWLRGLQNDIYFQIGLVTLIGLSAKNAILIVEFAALNRRQGMSVVDAAIEAARLRFRPIVMTSLAFTLGVVPLAISSGAGAAARHSIGTGVIGGMLAATFLATLFVPAFFRWVTRGRDSDDRTATQ